MCQHLASFLSHKDCRIRDLSLHEAELSAEIFELLINALKDCDSLSEISLSKNSCSPQICSWIVKLCQGHSNIARLCLSHCEIDAHSLEVLSNDIVESNIRYLNLAWN